MTTENFMPHLRILLLEDVTDDAELILCELRKEGIDFVAQRVETERDYRKQLQELAPDLILADYSLPSYDGLSALAVAKRERPEAPFIFVSGTLGEEIAVETLKQGATDYVFKERLFRLGPAVKRALREVADITMRKQAEDALKESESKFRSLAETSPVGILIHDGSNYRYVNSVFQELTGYTRDELMAMEFWEVVHPDFRELVKERGLARCRKEQPPAQYEFKILTKSGQERWMELHATSTKFEGKAAALVTLFDITKRKQTEDELREQAALLNQVRDAIIVQDLNGRIRFWNRGAERLYGWTSAEALGKSANEILHSLLSLQLTEATESLSKHGEWSGELCQVTKMDQTITVDSRWTFLRDRNDSPQAILVVNTDITDKKALQAKFLRAQRLESVGRLAGGIAHDLNNILSPLPMAVAMLREEVRSESGQAMLDTVESSAQRGANIVKQILTFARGIDGKRVVLQPKYLIKEMAKWIKETFPKSIVLKTEIPDKLWELNGDVTQLLQVLMNLCVNARDAMPNGGALTLGAENLWIDEVHSQLLPGIKAGNYVLLTVTDTGTGIPQEIIDRIFDPFFTTKKPDQGTGLGLSTALGLVRGHGGVVQVRSKIGQGTQFRIYLPAETAKTPAPPETVPQSLPKGNGEWILLVDDEAIIQEVTKKNLERYGYRVLTANDGKEAVTLYAKNQADIKVVLTDLNMPFMDGVAAIKAMKQTNPQAKFIVATGVGSSTYNENTPELKGHHFLIKPFSTEQLLCAVHKALQ